MRRCSKPSGPVYICIENKIIQIKTLINMNELHATLCMDTCTWPKFRYPAYP